MSRTETPTGAWALDLQPRTAPLFGPAVLAFAAILVALWPYTSVVAAGAWTLIVTIVVISVLLVGIVMRRLMRGRGRTLTSLITTVVQLVIAVMALTLLLVPQTALLWVLPSPSSFALFERFAAQAAEEVYTGVAPLDDSAALTAVLAMAFAAIAIIVDQLVAERAALVTAALITVVGAVPMIATLGEPDVVWFIALAILILVLLRHTARRDRRGPRTASVLTAVGTGTVAVLVAVIIAPTLPVAATWTTSTGGVAIDASLRLGDDLRRPDAVQVMTIATDETTAPYLRVATLSRFDGEIWGPDRGDTTELSEGFGDPEWAEDVTGDARQTSIRVLGLSSARLPVPYPAERVVGIGDDWEIMPGNRTVVSEQANASGADYTVTSATIRPTLEQITATSASDPSMAPGLPDDLPEIIGETARDVTQDAVTDYEKLIALQDWFRREFDYSIDTPVEEGFDGSGAEAIATFLDVRSGYCIHFAGAFALMARTLDMPVRIVVGYLPGRATEQTRGDEVVYAVMSDQLHAWPEVHFEGIGWVPFEPTATLGVPTAFVPAETDGGASGDPNAPEVPRATQTPAPTSTSSLAPGEQAAGQGGGDSLRRLDPMPIMLVTIGVLVALLLPALIRAVIAARRRHRAAAGDAASAWAELGDTMTDLGMPASDALTPRALAVELARTRSVDQAALGVLVAAIEEASYARSASDAGDLATPLGTVLAGLREASDPRTRFVARFLPRSLVVARPARDALA
ncbi:transglutaminase family protein [Microbacterium sp. NPDC055903]